MSLLELICIAAILSLDAFAASITEGMRQGKSKNAHILKLMLLFGGFQALMPCIGYTLGHSMLRYIEKYDHWVAAGLLWFIGGRMIVQSLQVKEQSFYASPLGTLFILAIATSIDALAAGVSFAIARADIALFSILTGIITAVVSGMGARLGQRLGKLFQKRAELFGGVVLTLIGTHIFIEHMH